MIFGPSIEPEKPSVKSASTPYPPQNDDFIAFLLKIIGSMVQAIIHYPLQNCFLFFLVLGIVLLLFHYLVFSRIGYASFSGFAYVASEYWCCACFCYVSSNVILTERQTKPSKKEKGPVYRPSLIVHYPISYLYHILSLPNLSGADIGPRYSLSTLTIGNTNVGFLIYHYLNHDRFYLITTHFHSLDHFLKYIIEPIELI
jgi:hypothetical protein